MNSAALSVSDWLASALNERVFGSSAGAILSLVYLVPRRWQEAVARFATGMICGLIFGPAVGIFLANQLGLAMQSHELQLAGACTASFGSWWALGLLTRQMQRHAKTQSETHYDT